MKTKKVVKEKLMSKEQFTILAITKLKKPPYKGIHCVYSGFNAAFKQYFGVDARETTQAMTDKGKIAMKPVKGGVMLYLPKDAPQVTDRGAEVLQDILN